MVLQRYRCAEHRHDAVAGELVHRAAVALHHRRAAVGQVGHDLAQPLRTHRRRDVHRMHHIGEQHRHLLVLRRSADLCDRRTALITELGVRRQLRAARPTQQSRRCQCTATVVPKPSTSVSCHRWSAMSVISRHGWPSSTTRRTTNRRSPSRCSHGYSDHNLKYHRDPPERGGMTSQSQPSLRRGSSADARAIAEVQIHTWRRAYADVIPADFRNTSRASPHPNGHAGGVAWGLRPGRDEDPGRIVSIGCMNRRTRLVGLLAARPNRSPS